MYATMPIVMTSNEVWVFFDFGDAVEVGRIAITHKGAFMALPPEQFWCDTVFPVSRITGEPVDGLLWADTMDIAAHPELFPQQ